MKRRVLWGAVFWTLFISIVHIHLNVGWVRFYRGTQAVAGQEREELMVGFLPVT